MFPGTPSAPSFGEFYSAIAGALDLQFGDQGALCAWTTLSPPPPSPPFAPWLQHGAMDFPAQMPSPRGPLFEMMQSLGSEILQVTITSTGPSNIAASVPVALGTLRKWATCLTVSVVVNVTAPATEGVCLRITGLSDTARNERCGPEGEGRAAATVVELHPPPVGGSSGSGGGNTTTRVLPCLVGGDGVTADGGSAVLKLRGGGTVTAVSFALSHL